MNVLVIGGTGFLGGYIVEELLRLGTTVTLFNRGLRDKDFLTGRVSCITGDRKGNLSEISFSQYDLVIDTCGYFPSDVEKMCKKLARKAKHYIYISSVSVYDLKKLTTDYINEESPVFKKNYDQEPKTVTWENYGSLKFQCEETVRKYFPNRSTIIRPGYIVGPHDYTYRFPYWVNRVALGGEMILPGDSDAPMQMIDVRDLAAYISKLASKTIIGTYNAVGPSSEFTFAGLLEICRHQVQRDSHFINIPESELKKCPSYEAEKLPLWSPRELWPHMKVELTKSLEAGLVHRRVEETISDTWRWIQNQERLFPFGMLDHKTEVQIIKEYNENFFL